MKLNIKVSEARIKSFNILKRSFCLIIFLLVNLDVFSQTVVNSLELLKPHLNENNVHIKLAPGAYNISSEDIKNGKFSNPLFLFEGNNSIYDFTGVTINIETAVMQSFGRADVHQIQITGSNNILKNLKMVDVGSVTDRPTWRATNVVMDGAHNKIEGFHMSVKGSWPYGYGDAFGKGGKSVIKHFKHCGLLVRGESNHVKKVTMITRAYGHGIYMQAANNPLIEDCYVEGEVRTTDDMLKEAGTGSPADKVNFKTVWGYKLQPGFMMSLQEEGIRAYNGGDTVIDGVAYKRGTSNVTIRNCTVKNMRGGVTITHATGKKYVEGCTTLGCERGYATGKGDIVNCSGDAIYGPVFGVDYESDNNINADITILSNKNAYNGNNKLAHIIGKNHKIIFRSNETNPLPKLEIGVSGIYRRIRSDHRNTTHGKAANTIEIQNYTKYPVNLYENSLECIVESCGVITDKGNNNYTVLIKDCNE